MAREKEKIIKILLNENQVDKINDGIDNADSDDVNEPCVQIVINQSGEVKEINIVGERMVKQEYHCKLDVGVE